MTQHKDGNSIYDALLYTFPDYKGEVLSDVVQDEDYRSLSKKDLKQAKKVIMYIYKHPCPGRRPAVPEEVEYIFRKYVG